MRGAEINWIPNTQGPYKFTGQGLTFEGIQRLRHEIQACMEALKSMSLLSDHTVYAQYQDISQTAFRVSRHP